MFLAENRSVYATYFGGVFGAVRAREAESIDGVVTDNFLFYGLQEFGRQKEPANHFDGANGKLLLNYSILTMLIRSTNDYKAELLANGNGYQR